MSKKSRFRGHFDKQHGKWDQIVLKFEWQHFYYIYWSLWRQLSSKLSLLVTGKILGLLSKTLAACHKYSLPNREAGNSDGIISKKENFFSIFPCNFWNVGKILNLSKKRLPSWLMYFGNYGLWRPWLDKYLKSPVSEDPSKWNMVNGPKHCWN